jgi:hypothetical protein
MIHEGEAVVPASANPAAGGSGGVGGNTSITMNVNAIDAQSFASALMSNRSALSQVIAFITRSAGASPLAS